MHLEHYLRVCLYAFTYTCMYLAVHVYCNCLLVHHILSTTCTGWVLASSCEQLVVGKVETGVGLSPSFRFSLTVEMDLTWKLHVLNEPVPLHSSVCHGTPNKLCTISDTQDLLLRVNSSSMCIGNPDCQFTEMMQRRKGVIMDKTGVTSCTCINVVCCHSLSNYLCA